MPEPRWKIQSDIVDYTHIRIDEHYGLPKKYQDLFIRTIRTKDAKILKDLYEQRELLQFVSLESYLSKKLKEIDSICLIGKQEDWVLERTYDLLCKIYPFDLRQFKNHDILQVYHDSDIEARLANDNNIDERIAHASGDPFVNTFTLIKDSRETLLWSTKIKNWGNCVVY